MPLTVKSVGFSGIGFTWMWWSHHDWRYSRINWTWHLVVWLSCQSSDWWKVGLKDLRALFQFTHFYDSVHREHQWLPSPRLRVVWGRGIMFCLVIQLNVGWQQSWKDWIWCLQCLKHYFHKIEAYHLVQVHWKSPSVSRDTSHASSRSKLPSDLSEPMPVVLCWFNSEHSNCL